MGQINFALKQFEFSDSRKRHHTLEQPASPSRAAVSRLKTKWRRGENFFILLHFPVSWQFKQAKQGEQ